MQRENYYFVSHQFLDSLILCDTFNADREKEGYGKRAPQRKTSGGDRGPGGRNEHPRRRAYDQHPSGYHILSTSQVVVKSEEAIELGDLTIVR